jgi:hypothetical protein
VLLVNLEDAMDYTAGALTRAYPLADASDIRQELWVWVLNHRDKLDEWSSDEFGEAKLYVALRNAGANYARGEQESRVDLGLAKDAGASY